MHTIDLILASSSPRRQAFFHALGLSFRILTAELDESPLLGESPVELVARLAQAKAAAVAEQIPQPDDATTPLIVAADTIVALDGEILGKPAHAQDATAMLQRLRGQSHQVHSAVALRGLDEAALRLRVNSTTVTMRDYTDAEIAAYVATGDPLDKAGAYALQDPLFAPAAELRGCLASVVGLPLADLAELLHGYGIVPSCALASICETQAAFACCTRDPGAASPPTARATGLRGGPRATD
ncbi:MAG: nucleoside triphosphate pyrophosphatase [Litorilinea sp.]